MNYTYKRDVIFKTDDIEVVMIEWQPGESSPVHKHGICSGIVKVLEGEVYEVPFKEKGSAYSPEEKRYFKAGDSFAEEALGIHQIGNDTDAVARTIHVYLPCASNEEIEL